MAGRVYSKIEGLMRAAGPANAEEILFTGRRYRAVEAIAMGLVNRVLPKPAPDSHVREPAVEIAINAPPTIRSVKIACRELLREPSRRDLGAFMASFEACFASEDFSEGVRAFQEKRPPRFSGS